ncbi:hypothetical protein LPUS_10240 [Lasallia pustulata]|uniref:Uncharacterized protein n=1 Tax=Lasallia pustulata TaxID=136370 RepID=A0A1W5D9C8_9LECA|nr:hypothetical protein LPUS_10240 [Lasallia pustulata]
MDKKLLLTIQSVCNADGVKVPWDKVGAIMGDKITDGAVIQHLAKLRQRMVAQGLSVPPPLRRGGASLISTGYSGSSYSASKSTAARNTKSSSSRATQGVNEEDEEDFDVDKASEPDEEFAAPRSKKVKREPKGKRGRAKNQDSDEDADLVPKAEKADGKRKRSQPKADKIRAKDIVDFADAESVAASRTLQKLSGLPAEERERRSSVDYRDLDDDDEFEDEYNSDEEYVGAGASFLELQKPADDGFEAEYQEVDGAEDFEGENKVQHTESPRKMVVLRIGKGERSLRLLGKLANLAVAGESAVQNESIGVVGQTTDYGAPSMLRGTSFSGHAIDRGVEQQLYLAAPPQDMGGNHSSSTPSRRSSTGYSAPSPQVSSNNAVDFARYGAVGHMHGYYPASDFGSHSMSSQSLQHNTGQGLPAPTSMLYSQLEAPGLMRSGYAPQANSINSFSKLPSPTSTNWGPNLSLTRDVAYGGFETGYGTSDMFDHGVSDDPMLGAEDGLEDYGFQYAAAE